MKRTTATSFDDNLPTGTIVYDLWDLNAEIGIIVDVIRGDMMLAYLVIFPSRIEKIGWTRIRVNE